MTFLPHGKVVEKKESVSIDLVRPHVPPVAGPDAEAATVTDPPSLAPCAAELPGAELPGGDRSWGGEAMRTTPAVSTGGGAVIDALLAAASPRSLERSQRPLLRRSPTAPDRSAARPPGLLEVAEAAASVSMSRSAPPTAPGAQPHARVAEAQRDKMPKRPTQGQPSESPLAPAAQARRAGKRPAIRPARLDS